MCLTVKQTTQSSDQSLIIPCDSIGTPIFFADHQFTCMHSDESHQTPACLVHVMFGLETRQYCMLNSYIDSALDSPHN